VVASHTTITAAIKNEICESRMLAQPTYVGWIGGWVVCWGLFVRHRLYLTLEHFGGLV